MQPSRANLLMSLLSPLSPLLILMLATSLTVTLMTTCAAFSETPTQATHDDLSMPANPKTGFYRIAKGEPAWADGVLVSSGYVRRTIQLETSLVASQARVRALETQVEEADALMMRLSAERDAFKTLNRMSQAQLYVERHNVARLSRERWLYGGAGLAAGAAAAAGVCYVKN